MPLSTSLDGVAPVQLRGLAFLSLSATGHKATVAGSTDAGGGITRTTTDGGTIPCRVDALNALVGEVAHQIEDRSTHLIQLPAQTSIASADRFVIDDVGTFEITAVYTTTREWVKKLEAVKLD